MHQFKSIRGKMNEEYTKNANKESEFVSIIAQWFILKKKSNARECWRMLVVCGCMIIP